MLCIYESFIIICVYNEFAFENAAAIIVRVPPDNVLTVVAAVTPGWLILLSFLRQGDTEDGLSNE